MRAFLTQADLRNASLIGAFLYGAQLDKADLTGADLTQADLTGADLRGATVTMKQLSVACANPKLPPAIDDKVRPPPPWPQPCEPWVVSYPLVGTMAEAFPRPDVARWWP